MCPSILLTDSIGTPFVSVTVVAKVCRALEGIFGTWNPSNIDATLSGQYNFTPISTSQCVSNAMITIEVKKMFDFVIESNCVNGDFVLNVNPSSDLDLSNSIINWNMNTTSIGTSTSNLNFTQYVNNLPQLINLPVSIAVTINESGCSKTQSINIDDIYCAIQKGISPNGDTKNDYFDLKNLDVKELIIYNRYGMKVYSKSNYTNEWVGQTDSGHILPDGTYYYFIEFNNNSNSKTGWIYLNTESK